MLCECCEEQFDRWDMDIVESEDIACEVNTIMRDFGQIIVFNFCCPQCLTELALIPLQTEKAKKFRMKNEKLRKVFAPSTVH